MLHNPCPFQSVMNLYLMAGVREYWIVDPVKKLVMVYDFENEDTEQYTFQDSIKVGIYEELRIDFAEM